MKKLILLLLVLAFFVGGGSLRTFALISTPTRDFPLSTPAGSVTGHWDQATQTLTISGNGKIDVTKWNGLKTNTTSLQLTADTASDVTIRMQSGVQFPDNARDFFRDVKAKAIEIDPAVDTSNVTNMATMFYKTVNFNGTVSFANTDNVQSMALMFLGSNVREVHFPQTAKLTDMTRMFFEAFSLEAFTVGDTSKVTTMQGLFDKTKKFNADIDRDVASLLTGNGMFANTPGFSGKVKLRNAGKMLSTQTMFHSSAVSEVEIDTLESVTNMHQMFMNTKNLQRLSLGDTSKAQDMSQMFRESTMNLDISFLRFDALTNGGSFIVSNDGAFFSRENYDKLLKAWEGHAVAKNPQVPVYIQAPYCLGKEARAAIIAKGYKIQGDRLDCGLTITERPAAKISSGTMTNRQFIIQSAAPIKTGDVRIEAGTLGYTNFRCSSTATLPTKVNCYLDITATPNGTLSSLKIKATDTMGDTETYTLSGYLIDNQKPDIAQVTLDVSNGIATPKVKLRDLPRDKGGAGLSGCNFIYTDAGGTQQTIPASTSTEETLNFNPSDTTHSLKVQCYDKVGNSSENLIKFPPIITFDAGNVTLSREAMTGRFEVYSPSSEDITLIQLKYSDNTPVTYSCRSQKDDATTPPFKNSPVQPVLCEYSGADRSGTLVVTAQDANGAEGQQRQSVILDTNQPHITISPENALTSGNLVIKIQVFDAVGIQTGAVGISSSLDHSDWDCVQSGATMVRCQFTANTAIQNGNLTITATDLAGNGESKTTSGYTIDQMLPTIDQLNATFQDNGMKLLVSFSGSDAGGAGLWKQSESGNPQFDATAISYGLASDVNCSNFVSIDSLSPQEIEPYSLNFEFNDVTQNGKYLCIVVKDKVGNTQTGALFSPLNLNIAPSFPPHTATIAENSAIGSFVSLLTGSDANIGDTLTYAIVEGNTGAVFSIQDNRLLVNGALDYETLSGYRLMIKVSDQYGLFGTGDMEITLNDKDEILPTLSTGSSVVYTQGATITPIVFTGSDNQAISGRKVTGLPAGLTFEGTTGATTGNLTISGTLSAPTGTYLISVELSDHEGNIALQTFTITIKTPSQPGYSGGGGKALSQPKNQNSDPQTPVQTENQVKFNDSDLFNPTIEDGKCYLRRPHQGIQTSTAFPTTEEFNKALSFLWSYEMTKYDSVAGYDPYRNLSRQEAAKIFSQFATNVLCRKPDQNLKVNYSDTENADPSLKPYITLAYQLGLMKGSGQGDGLFRPYEMISKAEVNAVLIRMILKAYLNETSLTNWFSNYNEVATKLGIINQGAGLQSVPRNDVALMLFRAYRNQVFDRQEIDYFSYVLKTRAQFLPQK